MENMTDIYSPPPATPMPANKNSIIENIKGKMTGNSENVSQTDNVPGQNMDQSQNIIYHETGKWQDRLLFLGVYRRGYWRDLCLPRNCRYSFSCHLSPGAWLRSFSLDIKAIIYFKDEACL